MEKEVRDYLLDHFLGNNLFSNCQYGFLKGRSTVLQCLERGGQINGIYTDVEKAFDKVPHQLLLQKLKLYKVDPSIINWIKSFICFRKQRVGLINGFFSEWTEVISGILQGTILGFRLFKIYIH